MVNAYFLEGTADEYLLVVRTFDRDLALSVIEAIKTSNIKELDEVAEQLETSLYGGNSGRNSKTRSKNKKAPANGERNNGREAVNPKRRT